MSVLATQTIVGTIGNVYELRTVGNDNRPVIDFSIAVTPRRKNAAGDWEDGETYWVNVTAWGRLAENVSKSFRKGDRVFVVGRTDMKAAYTKNDGDEVPARPFVTAEYAGLEISYHEAESKRESNGNRASGGASNPAKKAAPAAAPTKKAAPAAPAAKKAAPKVEDDDLNFLDDDDFNFEDDGEEVAF